MSLNLNKLEKVRKAGNGITHARCPACAESGGDRKILSLDAAAGRLAWTPTEAQGPGNYVVLVRATDTSPETASIVREVLNQFTKQLKDEADQADQERQKGLQDEQKDLRNRSTAWPQT